MDKKSAATNAIKLLGCYRSGAAEDPEQYVRSIAAVFVDYLEPIVQYVVGILPSESEWLPTVYEVRQACNSRVRYLTAPGEQATRIAQQLAERDRLTAKSPDERQRRMQFIAEQRAQLEHSIAQPETIPTSGPFTYGQFLAWAKLHGKSPRPIGAFEPGGYLGPETRPRKTHETDPQKVAEARQWLIGQIGQEAFDALPDAPAASPGPLKGVLEE